MIAAIIFVLFSKHANSMDRLAKVRYYGVTKQQQIGFRKELTVKMGMDVSFCGKNMKKQYLRVYSSYAC